MIDLLRQMFATPEAQADPYTWAAALLGHWAIGAALVVVLLIIARPAIAAAAVSLAYGVLWEGGQLLFAGAAPWDSALDWTAVTLGATTAAATWQHRRRLAAAAIAAVVVILTAGVGKRRP